MGRTALHLATLNGHVELAETLVPNSAIDTLDGDGDTLLRLATKNCHLSTVKILLGSGARVDLRGTDHHTALHSAAISGYESTALSVVANYLRLHGLLSGFLLYPI